MEEEKKKKQDEIEYAEFWQNRFGVATNPAESFDKFTKYISNREALEKLGKFNSVGDIEPINADFMTGLDSWMGEEDKKIIKYHEYYHRAH